MSLWAILSFLRLVTWGAVPPPAPVESAATAVTIDGPLAHVTVDRVVSLASLRVPNTGGMSAFDYALPANARAVAIEVADAESGAPATNWSKEADRPPEGAQKIPTDPSSTFRLVFQGGNGRTYVHVRYSYDLPLDCDAGRWHFTLPGATDLAPLGGPLRLDVRLPTPLRLHATQVGGQRSDVGGAARWRGESLLGPQTSTDVWLELVQPRGTNPGLAQALALASSLGLCRAPAPPPVTKAAVVMVVVDLSRSVGAVGLSHEREVVRSFLAGLSPDTLFNVVMFHRHASPLFPLARLVTKETLAMVDTALVPDRLDNGSDVVAGLQVARQQLEAEQKEDPQRGGLLLLVTDGSLPETLRAASLRAVAPAVPTAVALVRPDSDEVAPTVAQALLRQLPALAGGVFRSVTPPKVALQARAMASALAVGDWFDLRWGETSVAPVLAPGQGLQVQVAQPRNRTAPQLTYVHGGKTYVVDVATARPSQRKADASVGGAASTQLPSGVQVYRYPLAPPDEAVLEKGELERSVLRNALSLAYLPRARACYLNRTARDARSRDLAGRVRLSLEIERGELLSATVISSTLGTPDIERCLVENAYALILPRPSRRDASVQALLNLVFRPSPPEGPPDGGASVLDQEIEILLGPRRVLDPANPGASLPGI
ncbi:MAG: VWA domain-containing protein [Deltaproteobacteria bacterium]|nr:VWA domain-containing protein [Deltaproteobacteria bacterium]